jgi:hypothetical protein
MTKKNPTPKESLHIIHDALREHLDKRIEQRLRGLVADLNTHSERLTALEQRPVTKSEPLPCGFCGRSVIAVSTPLSAGGHRVTTLCYSCLMTDLNLGEPVATKRAGDAMLTFIRQFYGGVIYVPKDSK